MLIARYLLNDLQQFLNRSPSDPYRVLWLYLAQSEADKAQALIDLKASTQGVDESQWVTSCTVSRRCQ